MCKYDVASQLLDLHVFEEILGFDFRFSVCILLDALILVQDFGGF